MKFGDRHNEEIEKLNECDLTDILDNGDCKDWKEIVKEIEGLLGRRLYMSDDELLSYLTQRYGSGYEIVVRPYISNFLLINKR